MNQTTPSNSQQRPDPFAGFSGTLAQVDAINARLAALSTKCHLLTPSTTAASPPGCAVSFTMIRIDPATETHNVGGKRSLLRSALLRLANAAGISFDARASGRADDGKAPYLVHWHSSGAWRDLSGVVLPVVGDCLMDLRDGSAQAREVLASARGDTPDERRAKGERTLQAMRAKILEHAQSKSELRAIRRALAIRAYTEQELREKPFVVCKLVYLGHDEAPDVARENARAIREQMLGGVRALFGPPVVPTFQARVLAPAPSTTRALPPARVADAEIDDDAPNAEIVDLPAPAAQPEPRVAPAAATVCSRCAGKRQVCPVCMKLEGPHAECGDQAEWKPCPDCCASTTTMPRGRDTAPAAFVGEDPDAWRDAAAHAASEGRPAPERGSQPASPAAGAPSLPPEPTSDARFQFGKHKDTRLADCEDTTYVEWYRDAIASRVADPSKARWRDDNQAHLDEVDTELARRGEGQGEEPPPDDDFTV